MTAGAMGFALALTVDTLLHSSVEPPEFPPALQPPGTVPLLPGDPLVRPMPLPNALPTATPRSERDEAVERLRVQGLEPGAEGLARAAHEGDLPTVDLFLKAGVSAAAVEKGRPMLLSACESSQPVAGVERLVEWGADPNAATPEGLTPLMLAAAEGNTALLECLAGCGAVLDAADAKGHTALHFAVFAKAVPAIEWLIAQGVPPDGRCCDGSKSVLLHALEGGSFATLEAVIEKARPAEWCTETREALFTAVRAQNKPMVRLLLANHQKPPTPEGFRQPLLGYSIAWGEPAVLRLLLECGADPNTPLDSPVEPAFSRLIAQEVTRFYARTEAGMTPLMLAAGTGRLECVQALLKYGAKRGMVTRKSKFAAISFAARIKQTEIMQVLLGKSPRPEDQRVRIDISLSSQEARLWKDDRIVAAAPISTGRSGYATPSGRFVVTDKERNRFSNIYKVSMPYFMRLNCSEVGMHAGVVPNYPASHGCIRLPREAAIRFYREADVGTLVTIAP